MTAALISAQRTLGGRSLYHFVKMAWHLVEPDHPFIDNWHVKEICNHLEAVFRGDCKRLVINIPPGGMKSMLVGIFWPAWIWIQQPGFRMIFASYDGRLTYDQASKMLAIIRSEWYIARWGHRYEMKSVTAVGDFTNDHRGWRYSTSVGGPVTGRHADLIVVDDPIKPKELTKAKLEGAIEWWARTLSSRLRDHKTGRKLLIMQRLHERDLAGYVLTKEAHEEWTHLRYPMYYEAENPCVTPWGKDPRTEEGELFFASRFPAEQMASLGVTLGPTGRAAQFQQRPTPAGGAVFRREWFKYWSVLPDSFDDSCQSWDCTFKGTEDSDWVVGQVWGKIAARYFLIYQVRFQGGIVETMKAIRNVSEMFPWVVDKIIEDKANGSAVIEQLKSEIDGIIAVDPRGGKESRANAVTGLYEAGNVLHPEDAPWRGELEEEMVSFPKGQYDDQVDCATQALNRLRDEAGYFGSAMDRLMADGM